jgi:hypothetical protein
VAEDEVSKSLLAGSLPTAFERRRFDLAPGTRYVTSAAEWSGALVVIESGTIEVNCVSGGRRTFSAGDMLALDCLPLDWMRNAGNEVARLVAIRRRPVPPPPGAFIRISGYRTTIGQ